MNHPSIDRERFFLLTAAIAAAHCASPSGQLAPEPPRQQFPAPDRTMVVNQPQPEQTARESLVEVPPPDDATAATPGLQESSCRNEDGTVSCDFVAKGRFRGPACEGFLGSCELLKHGYGYKPRVAAAIAACWERVGPAACNMTVRQRCIREAFRTACPDPRFTTTCEIALDRCRHQHVRPDFDVTECVQALSSLEGSELEWAQGALGPTAEGCKLMFPVY